MPVRLAAFPKCYLDRIAGDRSMSVLEWIAMARELDADGLEMYDGFFPNLLPDSLEPAAEAIAAAGFAMPMFCCSPDFTAPDADQRKREVDRQIESMKAARLLGGPGVVCRVLSGQRHPGVERAQGIQWVVECIRQLLPAARGMGVVLGMENHYKDGFWQYPEFAQKADVFLEIVRAIPDGEPFGVQFDPSNAIVAGDDPLALLRTVAARVVSMHASDRFLEPGATLEDLRLHDGTIGYPSRLRHGVTGQGLNDYDAILSTLAAQGYEGWISIEDGMNGMEEMQESLRFLRHKCARYFPG